MSPEKNSVLNLDGSDAESGFTIPEIGIGTDPDAVMADNVPTPVHIPRRTPEPTHVLQPEHATEPVVSERNILRENLGSDIYNGIQPVPEPVLYDIKCGIKVIKKVLTDKGGGQRSKTFLASFDAMPPGTVYRGGDIEFTLDDYSYRKKLIERDPSLQEKFAELEESGISLPLAHILEHNSELLFKDSKKEEKGKDEPQFRFDAKALAEDMRSIKYVLSEAFVEFQRERFSHLNQEDITDSQARKMALSVFTQKIPEVVSSSKRLQVMLQRSDEERDIAAAAIMEAWSSAFAEYRMEIDRDIDELSVEQLQKIADGYSKDASEQFKTAKRDMGSFLMDYQNDLGFVFLGAFCPPLFIIAVIPLVLPFLHASMTKRKAYAEERKISGVYRKVDEKVEIATAAIVSRGVISDWIECNLSGAVPEFMHQINSSEGNGYLDRLAERHVNVRNIMDALFKNNFDKEITVGSGEHRQFEGNCRQLAQMLEDEFKKPIMDINFDSVESYNKILKMLTDNIPQSVEKNEKLGEKSLAGMVLGTVNEMSKHDISGDTSGVSLFDIYKGYAIEDFGSEKDAFIWDQVNIYKGEASALSAEQVVEFVKYKSSAEINNFCGGTYDFLKGTVQDKDKPSIDAVDLDMSLRSMVSYDTALSRRNSHEPKSGLDFLDAAFGYEHSDSLKDKTFWSELERTDEFQHIIRNFGTESMDCLKRLVIACSMAESYHAHLTQLSRHEQDDQQGNKDKVPYWLAGTAHIYRYYLNVTSDIEEITDRLGDENMSLFYSACSKITDKNVSEAENFDNEQRTEYNKLRDRYLSLRNSAVFREDIFNAIKNQDKYKNTDEIYINAEQEMLEANRLRDQARTDARKLIGENYDIYLANEIAARTSQKYMDQIRQGIYKSDDADMTRFISITAEDSKKSCGEGKKLEVDIIENNIKGRLDNHYIPLMIAGNETSLAAANEALAIISVKGQDDIGKISMKNNNIMSTPNKTEIKNIEMSDGGIMDMEL